MRRRLYRGPDGAAHFLLDERLGWLDRAASVAFGVLRQPLGGNNLDRDFLNLVATAAEGLDRLEERAMSEIVAELRRELHRHGLRPDLVARAFALIRELAGRHLGMRYGTWKEDLSPGEVAEIAIEVVSEGLRKRPS